MVRTVAPWRKTIGAIFVIAATACLNRLRGGIIHLPHRNLYTAALLLAFLVWFYRRDLWFALAIGAGFFVWGFRSWSIWIQKGFEPILAIQPPDVIVFDRLGGHTWLLGFFARHWVMLWPLQLALLLVRPGWRAQGLIPLLALGLTLSYALGWSLTPHGNGIATSEWIAGAAWGCFIVALCGSPGRMGAGRTGETRLISSESA